MDYKLIAIDVDGTLVNSQREITTATLEALSNAQLKGAKVTLATGRNSNAARPFAQAVAADAPLILCNGARVEEARSGKAIARDNVPLRDAV